MIDIVVPHAESDVKQAVVAFCARRGYRWSDPWYLEGVRIEIPQREPVGEEKRGFWASMIDTQTPPRVDVEVKKRRGHSSRVKMSIGEHAESMRLAYELQAYLLDDRAYASNCPPICPRCGNNVPNPIARYCGRCGQSFVPQATGKNDRVLGPPPVVAYEKTDERDPVSIERSEETVADGYLTEVHPLEVVADEPKDASATAEDSPATITEEHPLEYAEASEPVVTEEEASAPENEASGDATHKDAAPDVVEEVAAVEGVQSVQESTPERHAEAEAEAEQEDLEERDTATDEATPTRRMLAEE